MVTGVILAGGKNRRMNGKVKALLPFHGELLLQRQINRMKSICGEIIVAANRPDLFSTVAEDNEIKVITDVLPGKGPLSGMHAAFTEASHPDVWVVGCDMPFISAIAAEAMLAYRENGRYHAVIPYVDGNLHPLHGIYQTNTVDVIAACLKKERYKMKSFLEDIHWQTVEENFFTERQLNQDFTVNVNTPDQYRAALDLESGEAR
jgi:molybdopterin-guanine dinucleotide biosynthesis protein A